MKIRNRDSPVVYICSRYSGDVKRNTEMARRCCRCAVDQGCIPLAPHLLLPQFLSEETERDLAISIDLRFLSLCQELWVCGSGLSEGIQRELEQAALAGMPVRFVKKEDINVRN